MSLGGRETVESERGGGARSALEDSVGAKETCKIRRKRKNDAGQGHGEETEEL